MKKKKVKVRIIYIFERLFRVGIFLIICPWPNFLNEAKKALNKEKFTSLKKSVEKHGYDDNCLASQFPFDGGGSMVWANPKVKTETIVHEMVHVAFHILKSHATPLSEDTEETYAYLIEFLFKSFTQKIK